MRDEANAVELVGVVSGLFAEDFDAPRGRGQEPDRELQERALPSTIRSDETNDVTIRDSERAVAKRPTPAVTLAKGVGYKDGRHAISSSASAREVSWNNASMNSWSSSASCASMSQRRSFVRNGPWAREKRLQCGDDEGPKSWTSADEALELQLSVCLGDSVRIDRDASDNLFDGWELITNLKKSEPQRSANLLNEL